MRKKLAAMLLAVSMAVLMVIPAFAADSAASYEDFTDLDDSSSWYYEGVSYVIENGIMNGTSRTSFNPDGTCTRSMIVTILYRMEGEPPVSDGSSFTDVEDGQWYTDAVIWAEEKDITEGTGEGTFSVSGTLTREQFATFMYRYAEYKGYNISASSDLVSNFPDYEDVDSWAEDAMSWAVAVDLITGSVKDGQTVLAPTDSCTRSMAAVIIYRFIDAFVAGEDASDGTEEGTSDGNETPNIEEETEEDTSDDTVEDTSDETEATDDDISDETEEDASGAEAPNTEKETEEDASDDTEKDIEDDTEEVTVVDNGNCGSNLTWVLYSDGLLEISGYGNMTNWGGAGLVPWSDYCESITEVVISDGVTSIGYYAFCDCTSLESITIPDGVTRIGINAFRNCTSLESITIPDGVTSILNRVFYGCSSLKSIMIPDSVISIGTSAFSRCISLTDVYYSGTEEEWEEISINSGNSYLTEATIHYNSTGADV